jgi:hypothetical protein
MRVFGLSTLVCAATLMVGTVPALALDRPSNPAESANIVIRAADLDRPGRLYRHHGARHSWRYQAAYTRWLHNEYRVAGFPANWDRAPTYRWVAPCRCHRW